MKHCVLSVFGNENGNANADYNNVVFTIKDSKLYVPVVTLSAKGNKILSNFLSKGFESSVYWNEPKSENKNTTNEYTYFMESNFLGVNRLFVLIYPNQHNHLNRFNGKKYYLPKGITKNYNITINGKTFYDQPIHSDVKRYAEKRKLTTAQGKDYTTECLLDYEYIKNHYRLIAVDLSK